MTRQQLIAPLAIDRAEYEADVLARGYTEAAMQPMVPWVKDAVIRMAKRGEKIHGVVVRQAEYGWYVHANVDWYKLAHRVARAVPTWRATIERMAAEKVSA